MFSVCFPNTSCILVWKSFLSNHFSYAFRTPTFIFGTHRSCSWTIRGVRKSFSFRMHQELFDCFQKKFRTWRMLLECFPNILDATLGRSMKIILNMRKIIFELPNTEPNCQYAPKTHLKHTECFRNMISSLSVCFPKKTKFLFGKHSGQCDRAKKLGKTYFSIWRHMILGQFRKITLFCIRKANRKHSAQCDCTIRDYQNNISKHLLLKK